MRRRGPPWGASYRGTSTGSYSATARSWWRGGQKPSPGGPARPLRKSVPAGGAGRGSEQPDGVFQDRAKSEAVSPGTYSQLYSAECVEGEFCELRLPAILGSSASGFGR